MRQQLRKLKAGLGADSGVNLASRALDVPGHATAGRLRRMLHWWNVAPTQVVHQCLPLFLPLQAARCSLRQPRYWRAAAQGLSASRLVALAVPEVVERSHVVCCVCGALQPPQRVLRRLHCVAPAVLAGCACMDWCVEGMDDPGYE
jgi:hypothetical protein